MTTTNKEQKFRIGQVVKFKTRLKSGKPELIFGKITECICDLDGDLWYRMDEYPEKTEYGWNVPENKLTPVSIMEM